MENYATRNAQTTWNYETSPNIRYKCARSVKFKIHCKQFNILFANVGKSISDTIPHPINNFRSHLTGHFHDIFVMQPTYRLEMIRVTQILKNKSSQGVDKLSTMLVRETINEIATPLEHIINLSFVTGSVPVNIKIAKIIPIFKSGNNQLFNNYRPISILPALSKIMGHFFYVTSFFEKYNILYKHHIRLSFKTFDCTPNTTLIKIYYGYK